MTATGDILADAGLAFVTLDVFTEQRFAGNPLAVVMAADGLSDAAMQTIAREFNLSETAFVMAPRAAGNTARVRIFLTTAEIPFAGHPTIGCAIHLATLAHPEGDFETLIRLEEEAGLVPVRVWRRAGRIEAELTAPVLPHAVAGARLPGPAQAAAALGLDPSAIGFGGHRIGLWQGGPRFLYIPLCDRGALAAARPRDPAWSQMVEGTGTGMAYLYTPGEECDYRARMFAPGDGVPEDPATGSASAILAAQLLATGGLPPGETRLSLRQGVEMGRPSAIGLTLSLRDGALHEVRIAGAAVPVSSGRLFPP